eukprot:10722968-Lingulodinium_polyedra.AAC.1
MQLEAPMEGASARDLLHLSMSGRVSCCYALEHWRRVAFVQPAIAQIHSISLQRMFVAPCVGSQPAADSH